MQIPLKRTAIIVSAFAIWGLLSHRNAFATPTDLSVYQVGNSLTYDSRPQGGWAGIASAGGYNITGGYHIKVSSSLDSIWTNPDSFFAASPAKFATSLPASHWDAVVLQPYGYLAGPTGEAARAADFINLTHQNAANSNTKFYVYEPWPNKVGVANFDYTNAWNRTYDGTGNTNETKDFYSQLVAQERAQFPSSTILTVPVGDVLKEVDRQMKLGQISGVTPGGQPFTFSSAVQLYRDDLHLDDIGRFIAAATTSAVLTKTNPTGVTVDASSGGQFGEYTGSSNQQGIAFDPVVLTPELQHQLEGIVWSVVSNDPQTGIVPEPSSVGLVSMLLGGLGLTRRRRGR